jgi:membrane associated rhomboid family serine protease
MSITIIIVVITAITSFLAFNNQALKFELLFWPYRIWRNNEWHRLITGGFIHADGTHLIFNMISLFSFGSLVENRFCRLFGAQGLTLYVIMYLVAIVFADLYDLFTKRNEEGYRALGASGGVSAIVFTSILLDPWGKIYIMFIPVGIYGFIFGPLYLLYCSYMAKQGNDNIGHTAHFTGAISGLIFPIIFAPGLVTEFIHLIQVGP